MIENILREDFCEIAKIFLKEGESSSWVFHTEQQNTFIVAEGAINVKKMSTADFHYYRGMETDEAVLRSMAGKSYSVDDVFDIKPDEIYQITGILPTSLVRIGSPCFANDKVTVLEVEN